MMWLMLLYIVGTDQLAYTSQRYLTRETCEHAADQQVSEWAKWHGREPAIYPVCRPVPR